MDSLYSTIVPRVAGSFAIFAQETMGHLPGFLTGWNYWLAWVMGAATESVAAGTYFHVFVPSVSIWVVAGVITLIFSGDAALRLDVECLEAELADLGPVWTTGICPNHPLNA